MNDHRTKMRSLPDHAGSLNATVRYWALVLAVFFLVGLVAVPATGQSLVPAPTDEFAASAERPPFRQISHQFDQLAQQQFERSARPSEAPRRWNGPTTAPPVASHHRPANQIPIEIQPTNFETPAVDPLKQKIGAAVSTPTGGGSNPLTRTVGGQASLKVLTGLGVVGVILFAMMAVAKKGQGRTSGRLPESLVEVLGSTPYDHRRQLQLVRLGNKILLLSIGPQSVDPIGELTDPVEVEQAIQSVRGGQGSKAFQQYRESVSKIRQQRKAQRMYSGGPDNDDRTPSNNIFEA